jgi:hypothetical protein
MLTVDGRIAAAVDLPVTADLEAGYGATPAHVAETVRAIAAGIAGCNLEDAERPLPEAVARITAACKAADADSAGFVVNARLDMSVRNGRELEAAVERAGVRRRQRRLRLPHRPGRPGPHRRVRRTRGSTRQHLRTAWWSVGAGARGVRRGSRQLRARAAGAAMAALQRIGTKLLAGGDVDESLAFRPPV